MASTPEFYTEIPKVEKKKTPKKKGSAENASKGKEKETK